MATAKKATSKPAAKGRGGKKPAAKKPAPKKLAPDMLEVRPGRVLLWPNGMKRGGQGYVVRADDPFIADYRASLRNAEDGATPDEVTDRRWVREARAAGYEFGEGFRPEVAEQRAAKQAADEREQKLKAGGVEPVDPDELPDTDEEDLPEAEA